MKGDRAMTLQRPYTRLWLLWLWAFGVIEWQAIRNPAKGDTFSEHVWIWFDVRRACGAWGWVRRIVLFGLIGWLAAHFLTGGAF